MPNNLPLNWCECKLEDLCEVISKGSTPKNQTEQSINNQNSEEMAKKNQTQQPVVEAND